MALRIHGQMLGTPTGTDLLLFVCSFTEFVSSKLTVCNNSGGGVTFAVYVVPSGETVGTQHLIRGQTEALAASTSVDISSGITLARGDAIYVRSSAATTVFTLFGEGIGDSG